MASHQLQLEGRQDLTTDTIPDPVRDASPNVAVNPLDAKPGLLLPEVDDDAPAIPPPVKFYLWFNRRCMPHADRLRPWESAAEAMDGLQTFAKLLPPAEVEWKDIESDAALWLWVSQGYAAHRIERVGEDGEPAEQHGFVVRLDFMSRYAVREGFVRFGGDAYFDANKRPTCIRVHGKDVRPGDAGWPAAKFLFRSSTLVWVTLADHFARSHYSIVNTVLLATTRHLPKTSALRKFLKPFLFLTAGSNNFARGLLFPKDGFFHRVIAFSWEGLQEALHDAFAEPRVETFEQELRREGVHPSMLPDGVELPYVVEALAFWGVIEHFIRDAFERSNALRAALTEAPSRAWWADLGELTYGRNPEDGIVDTLTTFIFTATVFHAQAQNAQAYVRDPRFASVRVGEGQLIADRTSNLSLATLLSSIGVPGPMIDGDIARHMPDEGARESARRFHASLGELSEAMAQRNAARAQAYRILEPHRVAISIQV